MNGTAGSRQRWLVLATGLVLGALALALIGIRDQTASADETARASATSAVTIVDFEFQPAAVTIARGSKVRFSNASGRAHTATRKGSFDTGRIKPGKSVTVTFRQKGTFAYHCKIHSFMHGRIVVGS